MRRLAPLALAVTFAVFAPSANATTVDVHVGPGGMALFNPYLLTIAPGDTVHWIWDTGPHSVTSNTQAFADSGIHDTGFTNDVTFNKPGAFNYHCAVHPSMTGTVTVTGITGRVRVDRDASNSVTAPDQAVVGRLIYLYQDQLLIDSKMTGGDGSFAFSNPAFPGGFNLTTGSLVGDGFNTPPDIQGTVTDPTLDLSENNDFLIRGAGIIAGHVYNDLNGNGVHDAPEAGVAGISMSLGGVRTETTGADGAFAFENVTPEPWSLTPTVPAAYESSTPAASQVTLSGPLFKSLQQDFMFKPKPASISGVVRDDPNGNGAADIGEGTLNGATVGLDSNGDQAPDTTTATAADGAYSFPNLGPGTYRITLIPSAGYESTGPAAIEKPLAGGENAVVSALFARKIPAAAGPPPAGDQPPENVEVPVRGGGKPTNGNDRLIGSGKADRIFALGGNDFVQGLGGNDVLDGGDGDDTLIGGPGKDKLNGGKGNDKLTGNAGKDSLTGGPGNDTINSKDGVAERVNCGSGKDKVKADRKDKLIGCEKRT